MMNIRDRSAIHQTAEHSLANAKGDPKKILLIYLAIITGLSLAVAGVSILLSNRIADTGGLGNMGLRSVLSTAKSVLPLVQSVILLGLEMGYYTMALNITRGEPISNDTLFGGFRRFFPLLRAQILLSFLYLGLGLLAVYPGANPSDSTELAFALPQDLKYPGNYTGTVTFTIAVNSAEDTE
jgi:uncharacterized membrane protein